MAAKQQYFPVGQWHPADIQSSFQLLKLTLGCIASKHLEQTAGMTLNELRSSYQGCYKVAPPGRGTVLLLQTAVMALHELQIAISVPTKSPLLSLEFSKLQWLFKMYISQVPLKVRQFICHLIIAGPPGGKGAWHRAR